MGWRPRDVYECTAAEFEAAWQGWAKLHTVQDEGTQFATRDDLDNLLAWHASKYG
jgi:hypothetical protein